MAPAVGPGEFGPPTSRELTNWRKTMTTKNGLLCAAATIAAIFTGSAYAASGLRSVTQEMPRSGIVLAQATTTPPTTTAPATQPGTPVPANQPEMGRHMQQMGMDMQQMGKRMERQGQSMQPGGTAMPMAAAGPAMDHAKMGMAMDKMGMGMKDMDGVMGPRRM